MGAFLSTAPARMERQHARRAVSFMSRGTKFEVHKGVIIFRFAMVKSGLPLKM